MKGYDDLTEGQQELAVEHIIGRLLGDIIEGGMRFNDEQNGDDFQAVVDAAIEKANDMRTPWFANEYIMEARFTPVHGHVTDDDGKWQVADQIAALALPIAEDAFYLEDGEETIRMSLLETPKEGDDVELKVGDHSKVAKAKKVRKK